MGHHDTMMSWVSESISVEIRHLYLQEYEDYMRTMDISKCRNLFVAAEQCKLNIHSSVSVLQYMREITLACAWTLMLYYKQKSEDAEFLANATVGHTSAEDQKAFTDTLGNEIKRLRILNSDGL